MILLHLFFKSSYKIQAYLIKHLEIQTTNEHENYPFILNICFHQSKIKYLCLKILTSSTQFRAWVVTNYTLGKLLDFWKNVFMNIKEISFHPSSKHTALTKHLLEFDHGFDEFDNVKVVDKEANLNQRILLGTLHMIKQPSVNLRYETPKIQDYYPTLLKK